MTTSHFSEYRPLRVVVTGGRDYRDAGTVAAALGAVHHLFGIAALIEGEARGADALAKQWAELARVPVAPYAADWKRWDRMAGFIRNQAMIDHGKPDLAVAFPGGRGTADMVRRCERFRVPVWRFA